MVVAFVLVNAQVDRINEVGQALTDIDGVSEVYSVAGEIDLVAMVRVPEHDQLAAVIAGRINKTDGVVSTRTMIAFQDYSRRDLDAAFSLGG